ncbi:AAA family ATPase [Kitasatospora sp. McL0602]|uniref:AAA family ATPase n=1 Tax=Kitasatospora sp. McL0602 TaxID=3439530 RepID=UPI003F8A771C
MPSTVTDEPQHRGGSLRLSPSREALLRSAAERLARHGSLLLHGPGGIGRTTLVRALAARTGWAVLHCTPDATERHLPFVGLVDLLDHLPRAGTDLDTALAALPPQPRAALRTALLRGEPATDPHDLLSLHLAVSGVLRAAAETRPLLLLVDGLQWLDAPTAELLAFLARRTEGTGLRLLATERTPWSTAPRHLGLCPPGTHALAVPPLDPADLADLLATDPEAAHAGSTRAALHELHRLAGGNPLHALELARSGHRQSPGSLPAVPERLRTLLLEPLTAVSPAARHALLLVSAASHPTLDLLRAAGVPSPGPALAEPLRLGALTHAPDATLRFGHPLLRAAVLADAAPSDRLAAHAALAAATQDPFERARQLAQANPDPDEALAQALSAAADRAPDLRTAYELTALAAARTPRSTPAAASARWGRLLNAAERAAGAGLPGETRTLALQVLHAPRPAEAHPASTGAPTLQQRTEARLLLLRTFAEALTTTAPAELIEQGLAESAPHPTLHAALRHWAAARALQAGQTSLAVDHAEFAARAGDRPTRVAALGLLTTAHSLRGEPHQAGQALDQARTLAVDLPPTHRLHHDLLRLGAQLSLETGRLPTARRQLDRLADLPGATFAGRAEAHLPLLRLHIATGACEPALTTARSYLRLTADGPPTDGNTALDEPSAPEPGTPAAALYAIALAQLVGGRLDQAIRFATAAVHSCTTDGHQLLLVHALDVLARSHLLETGPVGAATAVEALQLARGLGQSMEAADTAAVLRLAALVEGLVTLGEHPEAAQVLAEARALLALHPADSPADSADDSPALAAVRRAEALLLAATGHTTEAAGLLRTALSRLTAPQHPLERVATLVALGSVERRARRRAAARAALTEAREICVQHRALPLLYRVERELDRAGDRTGPDAAELTTGERRVAGLVADGATNREVAAALFMSVKTVEGTLSRVYRKLGVRSRTALARTL